MRVLQITQYLALGGLERCVTNLAAGLALRGNQSSVAVYEKNGLSSTFCNELHAHGVSVYSWQKLNGFSFRTLFYLFEIVRQKKIEIIHSHDLGALIYAVIISFLLLGKVKIIHTQHSFVHLRKGKFRYFLYEKFFPRFANIICSVSRRVQEVYRQLGIPEKKLAVVSNGVAFPSQFVSSASAREALSRRYPSAYEFRIREAEKQQHLLIFMGRIVPGKGIDRLMRAWQQLPERTQEAWRVLLVGPINDEHYLSELNSLTQRGVASPVFLGATDVPNLFYQACDAFVSLSEEEGMPLAVYEAIGFGLPALLSDIPGHSELKSWASFLPANSSASDPFMLQKFLEQASKKNDRKNEWNQKEQFRAQYSFQEMVKNYTIKYKSILMILAVFMLNKAVPLKSFADVGRVQLTSLVERPEYIRSTDWQSEVSLELARGESTLLTLKANSWCGSLPILSANLKAAGLSLRWYGGVGIPVTKPSYEGVLPGKYIDALVPISAVTPCHDEDSSSFEWLFTEITAGRSAQPGSVSGFLQNLMYDPGNSIDSAKVVNPAWKLKVDILPLEMPDKWTLPMRAEFTPFFASLAHYGQSGREEASLTQQYIKEMIENRILPLKAWIKHPFQTLAERSDAHVLLSRYPSLEMSILRTVIDFLPPWARVDLPRIDSPSSDERRSYWKRWQDYLDATSDDTIENGLIERMRSRPFVYLWDEPVQEDFMMLYKAASDVKASAPSVSSLVTVYPWKSLQENIDIFAPLLQTLVREGKPSFSEERELWSYVSCMSHGCGSLDSSGEPDFVIERNAAYIRVWPWMADEYQLSTVLYYSVNNVWRKAKTQDPWKDLYDFTGNGDGTLFYPGRPGNYGLQDHTPVPSLRMKFWKQGSFDAEYINWARQLNPVCLAKTKSENLLVTDGVNWAREPRKYQSARADLIKCVMEGKLRNPTSD